MRAQIGASNCDHPNALCWPLPFDPIDSLGRSWMKLQLDGFAATFDKSFCLCRNQSLFRLMTTVRLNHEDDICGVLEIIDARFFQREIEPARHGGDCGRQNTECRHDG